ncbi:14324_t:CDS:2, partial [Acaulospora colombiana]
PEETVSGSIGEKNTEFFKPPPALLLEDMLPEVFVDKNIGKVFRIPEEIMPKFEIFKFPPILGREVGLTYIPKSVELIKLLESASKESSANGNLILSGQMGAGKSALLLQAVNCALCSGKWIVIYISDAIKYVNSTHPYAKDKGKDEFIQPTLANELCKQIKLVNEELLEG